MGCGDDGVHHLADAPPCTPAASTVTIEAPSAYACHDLFKSKISITNNSCAPMTVQNVTASAMVTTGACGPAGPGTYTPAQTKLAVAETAVVLDLTAGAFCCTAPGPCPTPFQCDEAFTFTVTTNAGPFSSVSTPHLSLDACTVICP